MPVRDPASEQITTTHVYNMDNHEIHCISRFVYCSQRPTKKRWDPHIFEKPKKLLQKATKYAICWFSWFYHVFIGGGNGFWKFQNG